MEVAATGADGSVAPDLNPWSGAPEVTLARGDVLMREGEHGGDVFTVVSGSLEILRGAPASRIDVAEPGTVLGEIAALAGSARTATVRALEPSVVRVLDASSYARWLTADERRLDQVSEAARLRIDRHRSIELVTELLEVPASEAAEVVASGEHCRLDAGEVLFSEGEESDAGYLVVSGRLAVTRAGVHIGDVSRGQVVGEGGLLERRPRSATVTALRETTLARFSVEAFETLAATHPVVMLRLSRTLLARLGRPPATADRARSVAVAVTTRTDNWRVAATMAAEIGRHGAVRHLSGRGVDDELGRPGITESQLSLTRPAVTQYLHEMETSHDYLVLEADAEPTRWTRQVLALADRVIIVCSWRPDGAEWERIDALLGAIPAGSRAERWLAAVHPRTTARPSGTAALASRARVERVVHLRDGSDADLRRLARLVSGNATGLVLGGGGARGFGHLGVWRALHEVGVEVDTIGGASIGAALGAAMALQAEPAELLQEAVELFDDLLDYTIPVVSLVRGRRIMRKISALFPATDVRDVWLPYFCVSTNLTRSRVEVHERGDIATAIRASVAIPGILPPVPFDGDLLVDGGVLNNLPCDVMRTAGTVRRLIAVDLSPPAGPRALDDFGLSVSGWSALRSRWGAGGSRFPRLMSILMRSLVAGSVRDRDRLITDGLIDWYLDLDLRGVQLLDFGRVVEIAERGYAAALPRLEAWVAEAERREDETVPIM